MLKARRSFVVSLPRRIAVFGLIGSLLLIAAAAVVTNAQPGGSPPTFSKAFAPDPIGPGSSTKLRFDITNSNITPVSDLAFTDTMPAGMTIATPASASTTCGAGATLSAPNGGNTISLSGGKVGANSSCSVTVNIVSATVATHMNVSGDLTSSAGNSGPAGATLTVNPARPGFSKVFSPGSISLGQISTLTFTIDNTANKSNLNSLDFSDTLPTGMIVATPSNAVTNCGTSVIPAVVSATPGTGSIVLAANGTFGFPALGAAASCTVSVDVTTVTPGVFENTSSELLIDFTTSAGFATATLDVALQFLNKSFVNDPVVPGGTVELQFIVQNPDRDFSATGIAFTDDLTTAVAGLTFASLLGNDCGGTVSGVGTTNVIFSGGTLGGGATCTIRVSLTVPSVTPGTYTNTTGAITATIDGSGVTGNMATDVLVVSEQPTLTKLFVGDPVGAGDNVTLRFTIQNNSTTSGATDIEFIDELTDGSGGFPPDPTSGFLPFPVSVVLPATPCGAGSSIALVSVGADRQGLSLTGGSLAESGMTGDSCTFDVTVSIPVGFAAGTYTNTTEVITATVGGVTLTGLPASDNVDIVAAPRLLKEFTNDPVQPGDTVTMQFTLTHAETAPGDATNISFSDDLTGTLAGLTATGATVNTCGGMAAGFPTTNFQYSGGSLTPGSSCTITLTLDVPAAAAGGSYRNTTSNVNATVLGVTATENPASDDLRIAGLELTKEFIDDPVVPGDNVTLRFTLNNTNATDDATGIVFSDNLAAVLPNPGPDLTVTSGLPLSACGGTLDGTPAGSATFLLFTGGSLNAGDPPCSFDVTVNVPAGAADGTYNNVTSGVSATLGGSAFTGDPATDRLTIDSKLLQLTKEFTNDPVVPGGNVSLEFTLTNLDAAQAASGVGFTDNLNATVSGLTYDSLDLDTCGGTVSGTGTTLITVSGVSLAGSGSCTIRVMLSVPISAVPNNTFTNTTSQVTGTIGGFAVFGDPGIDNLRTSNPDQIAPVISYTPIPNTTSTANPMVSVTAADAVGVNRMSIIFRKDSGAFASNACTISSGTAQSGVWNCTIPGMITNPSAIAYYITAEDGALNAASNPSSGVAAPNLFAIGAGVVPAGTYTNLGLPAGASLGGDVTVLGVLTLGGTVSTFGSDRIGGGAFTLTLGCAATISGGGPTNYLIGILAKQYCAPGMFTYPVGTAADGMLRANGTVSPEYSPLTANVTAVGTVPSTLAVQVTDAFLAGSDPAASASRLWDLAETGDLTANISFTYLDQDVNGNEAGYQVLRRFMQNTNVYGNGSVDPGTNTGSATGVSESSQWTVGILPAPVNIGGRVTTAAGRGINGATVILVDPDNNTVTARTNPFGYYRIYGVRVVSNYSLEVEKKGLSFVNSPRVISVNATDLGINFVATPPPPAPGIVPKDQ